MVSPGSWILRLGKSESEHGIQPFVRASIHIPDQTADQERERAGESRKGWVGREWVGMEQKKEKDHVNMLEKRESHL